MIVARKNPRIFLEVSRAGGFRKLGCFEKERFALVNDQRAIIDPSGAIDRQPSATDYDARCVLEMT